MSAGWSAPSMTATSSGVVSQSWATWTVMGPSALRSVLGSTTTVVATVALCTWWNSAAGSTVMVTACGTVRKTPIPTSMVTRPPTPAQTPTATRRRTISMLMTMATGFRPRRRTLTPTATVIPATLSTRTAMVNLTTSTSRPSRARLRLPTSRRSPTSPVGSRSHSTTMTSLVAG